MWVYLDSVYKDKKDEWSNYKCDKIIFSGIKIQLVRNKYYYRFAPILKTFYVYI